MRRDGIESLIGQGVTLNNQGKAGCEHPAPHFIEMLRQGLLLEPYTNYDYNNHD